MRVRAAAFAFFALTAAGCSDGRAAKTHPESPALVSHLSAKERSYGVILDAKSGRALAAFRTNNPIRAAISDGRGGWYIGGGFIHVNGVLRKRLAHIRSDGTLDPKWRPEANGNGVSVSSLAKIGSRVYVGGDFARLDRAPRLWLGAVDAATGKLLRWQPPRAAVNYPVLLAGRDRIYLGGYGVATRSGLIALRASDGRPSPRWHGIVDTSNIEGGSVRILALQGQSLYLAGMFGKVNGTSLPGIAAVDVDDGRLLHDWRPPLRARFCTACSQVGALAAGTHRVFAGTGTGVVALDPGTGAVEHGFRTRIGLTTAIYGGAAVNSIAKAGRRLYLTGYFDSIDGARREAFGAVDAATGRVVNSWTPDANQASGSIVAASGSRVLVGMQLGRAVQFDVGGLEAARQPFAKLDVVLALSGAGLVRIGLGRRCNVERWAETGRCEAPVTRWLGTVRFDGAGRRHFVRAIPGPPGRYFVRFIPRARGGPPQPAYDDAFRH
jgi:outer membrane protein assembly factor BamB